MRGAKSRHTHIQAYTLTTTRICTALGTNTALRLQIFDPELRHKHVSAPPGWAGWGIEIWGHSDIGVLVYRRLEHQTRDYGGCGRYLYAISSHLLRGILSYTYAVACGVAFGHTCMYLHAHTPTTIYTRP